MSIKKPKRGRPKKNLTEFKLPSEFEAMDSYIKTHVKELSDRVVSCVDHAIRNNLDKVVIFKFDKTPYSVTLLESDYLENIQHIYDMYIENEYYEDCHIVGNLLSKLKHD